jgi:transposase
MTKSCLVNTEALLSEIQQLKQTLEQHDEVLAAATKQCDALAGENRVLRTERDLLKERLNKFIRKIFAAKSEALASQKDMFFNEAEALAALTQAEPAQEESSSEEEGVEVAAHKRKVKRGRKRLDPALPREVIRHELPESERVCPHDGAALREIGVEASEQLDIIPQQVRVIRHERVKYACPCCDGALRLAAKPAQIIPKGLLTEAALAWVITAKYEDALPLYRQAALLGRFGGELSRNTLAASVARVGQQVQPLVNLMRDLYLDSAVIHGDETELQVLKEPGRAAQAKSYLWAQSCDASGPTGTGPPLRLYSYAPSRSAVTAQQLYAGARAGAVIMTDGYEVYASVALANGLIHLGCMAHCRRYWFDALKALPRKARTSDQLAAQVLELIAQLYAVEERVRSMDSAGRLRERREHSVGVLARIDALVQAHLHSVMPGSELGKALHYTAAQWPKLTRYVQDASWPIDNNSCENAIRPFVVGRNNWLFSDTVAGAKASANLYSLLQTCRANAVNTYDYLTALFTALPLARTADDYEALLPWRITLPAA